jgi:phage protein D
MHRRSKVHDDLDVTRFVEDLAGQLGLQPRASGVSGSLGTQVQLNESDLAFLRRILAERDAELQVIEGELHVRPHADVRRGQLDLALGSDLIRCRFAADLAHQITQVTVSGWDAEQGKRFGATSRVSDLGPGSGRTGASWLTTALGARSEHVAHVPARNEDEARAIANAAHAQRARGFVKLDATAYGDPRIRVGAHVAITGVAERFENTFVVTRTTHRFDGLEGYKTDFEAESAYLKGSS